MATFEIPADSITVSVGGRKPGAYDLQIMLADMHPQSIVDLLLYGAKQKANDMYAVEGSFEADTKRETVKEFLQRVKDGTLGIRATSVDPVSVMARQIAEMKIAPLYAVKRDKAGKIVQYVEKATNKVVTRKDVLAKRDEYAAKDEVRALAARRVEEMAELPEV